jgi:hypothetical protein
MACIWFAQLDPTSIFFDTTSAQGDLGWSSGQAMGIYSCAGVTSKVKHTRARKYQHKHDFFLFLKRFHLLSSRLFGGAGVFL